MIRFDGIVGRAGHAPAGTVTLTLGIYDAAEGGTLLWDETQVVGVDASGRYAVLVGGSRAEGLPTAVLAGAAPRWLEVSAAGSAAPTSRALLTSVPYALRAADADTLGGLPVTAFVRAPEPGDATAPAADTAVSSRDPIPSVNSGTANYIGKFTNAIDLTSSALYEANGRIGLGTTNPLDVLHTRFSDGSGGITGYAVQNLSGAASAYSGMLFYDQNGALGQFQGFNNATHEYRINNIASGGSINFMLASQPRFTVTSTGIGIGTASPQDPLHISSGFIRAANGLRMGSGPVFAGISQEIDGTVANIGVNDGRLAAHVTGHDGGFFRVDNRFVFPLFQWWSKSAVDGTETSVMSLQSNGRLTVPAVRTTAVTESPLAVMVGSDGLLGISTSSRRYKENIRDMGDASNLLMALRPVIYHYKTGAGNSAGTTRPLEYGLIAEEVAEIYPDLVARLADGEIQTVQYHKVNAMLLNEVQKQHRQLGEQSNVVAAQQREIEALKLRLTELERVLTATRTSRER